MTHDRDLLTVLVPFKNRYSYVRRFIDYANLAPYPYQVLFADGSAEDQVVDFLGDPAVFPNVSYRYLRCPFDASLGHFFNKVANALDHVQTPFTAIVSDDDFCFLESQRAGLRYLQEHPDYVAAVGALIDFGIVPEPRLGPALQQVYGGFGITGKIYRAYTYDQDTAADRIRAYLTQEVNTTLWQAVCRTDILQDAWRTLGRLGPRDYRFADQIIIQKLLVAGKTYGDLPVYMLHQANPAGEGMGSTMLQQDPTWLAWIQRQGWLEDFARFVGTLGHALAERDGLSAEAGRQKIMELFYLASGRRLLQDVHPQHEPGIPVLTTDQLVGLLRGHSEFERIFYFLRGPLEALERSGAAG